MSRELAALLAFAAADTGCGVIALTRLPGVPNEGAFYVAEDGLVLATLEASSPPAAPEAFAWRGSSTGVLLLRKPLLAPWSSVSPLSLERIVLPDLIGAGRMRASTMGRGASSIRHASRARATGPRPVPPHDSG